MKISSLSLLALVAQCSLSAAWISQHASTGTKKTAFAAPKLTSRMTALRSKPKKEGEPEKPEPELLIPIDEQDPTTQSLTQFMENSSPEDVFQEPVNGEGKHKKRASTSRPFSQALLQTSLSESEKEQALPEPVPMPNMSDVEIPQATSDSISTEGPLSPELQAHPLTPEDIASALPEPSTVRKTKTNKESYHDPSQPISKELQENSLSELDKVSALPEPLPAQEMDHVPSTMEDEHEPTSKALQQNHLSEVDKGQALPEPTMVTIDESIAYQSIDNEHDPTSPQLQAHPITEMEKATALPEPTHLTIDESLAHQPVDNPYDPFSPALQETQLSTEETKEVLQREILQYRLELEHQNRN